MEQGALDRREFFKIAASGISALGTSFLFPKTGFGAPRESSETLRVGYLPITDATPLLIAHANGYYHEEGLNVAEPKRVRDWSSLSESFLTGKFNVVHMLLPIPIWMRYNHQMPVKIMAWDHTNGSAITVVPDGGINGFSDLGGRQIAIPYWYSMHNIILQMGLKKVGLKPVIQPQSVSLKPDEVNLFVLPPPEMPVALSGKKIDGYIVAEPFNALGEIKIGARIMRFTGDIWKNHPCCVVVMKESLVRSKPVFTQKVINAIVRAQLYALNNPEKTAYILSREGKDYLPVSEDILKRVFTGYDVETYAPAGGTRAILHPEWNIGRIGFQPYPYPSATRLIVKEMAQTLMEGNTDFLKTLKPGFVAKDLVDEKFVRHAIDTVGGPGKFGSIDIGHPWEREEIIDL